MWFIYWCGVVWCGVAWRGVVWCGVVWRGVVWCCVVYIHIQTYLARSALRKCNSVSLSIYTYIKRPRKLGRALDASAARTQMCISIRCVDVCACIYTHICIFICTLRECRLSEAHATRKKGFLLQVKYEKKVFRVPIHMYLCFFH